VQAVIGQDRGHIQVEAGIRPALDQDGINREVAREVDRPSERRAPNRELDLEVAARIGMQTVGHRLDLELVVVVAD
jgi:hypothetical protein